jgi:DNA (cytosine-5)-methyltransferase 1
MFTDIGYDLSFQLLNVSDYGVPQDRKRVFFIGYRKDLGIKFTFPKPTTLENKITLEKAISDLKDTALPAKEGNYTNRDNCKVLNHEYMIGGFSSMFMSRNRVRSWDEVSFTIQAGGRHAPIHPQAPKMKFIEQNLREFVKDQEHLYRRLSIRECARIQTFPDTFSFEYTSVVAGYKMIGNAVPVRMGKVLAQKIYADLENLKIEKKSTKKNIPDKINGNIVLEKMNEIINSISV